MSKKTLSGVNSFATNVRGWVYLLPALAFLIAFMVYPLIDVFISSFEEGYNSASQSSFGVGIYNYRYVLRDPYFLQAVKNTFILVIITVPASTVLSLLIALGLNSITALKSLFRTVFFLPYVRQLQLLNCHLLRRHVIRRMYKQVQRDNAVGSART